MNEKDKAILVSYRKERKYFLEIENVVSRKLKEIVRDLGIEILSIEHRVKTEESLAGKIRRNGDKYRDFEDITDILGARVICFFSDDVDRVGECVEQEFVIDSENSSDKRALIKADSFGYLSLHYICSLPENKGYAKELCNKKFEIQIRTGLQHIWAAINHDIGYKTKFGVPRAVTREFSRLAGLLELADEEFVRVRDDMLAYTADIHEKIINNTADSVSIDMVSLKEYMLYNLKMRSFLKQLAEIEGSEIADIDPEGYIDQLAFLGKSTLGDLQKMLDENEEKAYELAHEALKDTGLDILSVSVGLLFLCRAELINKGYSLEKATEFMKMSIRDADYAEKQAKKLLGADIKDGE